VGVIKEPLPDQYNFHAFTWPVHRAAPGALADSSYRLCDTRFKSVSVLARGPLRRCAWGYERRIPPAGTGTMRLPTLSKPPGCPSFPLHGRRSRPSPAFSRLSPMRPIDQSWFCLCAFNRRDWPQRLIGGMGTLLISPTPTFAQTFHVARGGYGNSTSRGATSVRQDAFGIGRGIEQLQRRGR
jgi:hypothetical protein